MKTLFPLIVSLLYSLSGISQTQEPSFPDNFFGKYRGTLTMYLPNDEVKEIPMEFHLLKTDTVGSFTYKLIYNGEPRDYILLEKNREKGLYEVDENNGIILPSRVVNNTLFSFFQVGSNFLSSRLSFYGQHIEFEILFSNVDNKTRTGENTDYEIYGFPISTVHTARLDRY